MMWTRIILALVVLSGLAMVSLSYLKPSPNAEMKAMETSDLVAKAAEERLGRAVSVREEFRKEDGGWLFVCGTVTEADGTELALNDAYESADYCALQKSAEADRLTEFDFGSTDMPAMDWMETHALPPNLLSE